MNQQILPVNDIVVHKEIAETPFFCDLKKCKGACCTLYSDYGAPLKMGEIKQIDEVLETVKTYLPLEHLNEIESKGFYEIKDGEALTRSVKSKACVFVYYENSVAKCSIEKAYVDDKTNFKKPISCHLFPVRITDFGGDVLRFEKFDECAPALEKGKENNVTVAEFCEESLSRLYGNKWYSKLKEVIGR